MVKEKLTTSQLKMKLHFDKKSEDRSFLPGYQVLVLSTMVTLPFEAKFSGPYTVLEKLNNQNYLVSMPDRRKKQHVMSIYSKHILAEI